MTCTEYALFALLFFKNNNEYSINTVKNYMYKTP